MMLISFFAILAAISPIEKGSIASNNASYDGTALRLEGEVSLEHGFGTMKAEKAVLTKEREGQDDFPFTSIELTSAVNLMLTSEAQVECEKALLDFSTLQGTLTSPQHVHYTDFIRRENQTTPFELFSPKLDLQLIKDPQKKDIYDIEQARAQNGVHLIYDKLYHLQTESILFSNKIIQSDGASPCIWTYQNDRVNAEKFDLDLVQNELFLKKAEGHLSSFSKGQVQFTAGSLCWEHTKNHLTLQGSPFVQESSVGTVTSQEAIHLFLKDGVLHQLKTDGQTTLTSLKGHRLTTYDALEVDGDAHLATISSPSKGEQLLYEEEEMTLRADKAQIHYKEEAQGISPASVELEGRIQIYSKEKEGPSRRGIADLLTYDPDTRTCILKAHPGRKVLFMRDQDQLRISANEVHIFYDPVSKEQQVRGVGHVTMSLSPEEQNLLNQVFRHVPSAS